MKRFLLRFSPFHVPVSRRIAEGVNSLINTVLHSKNTNILKMNTAQALAVIETAKNALLAMKARNAALATELAALRDANAGHADVVKTLNDQIASLAADDAAVDAALADLAAAVTTETPDPVPVPEPEPPAPAPVSDGTTSEPV